MNGCSLLSVCDIVIKQILLNVVPFLGGVEFLLEAHVADGIEEIFPPLTPSRIVHGVAWKVANDFIYIAHYPFQGNFVNAEAAGKEALNVAQLVRRLASLR